VLQLAKIVVFVDESFQLSFSIRDYRLVICLTNWADNYLAVAGRSNGEGVSTFRAFHNHEFSHPALKAQENRIKK
jgi:hypothetical protein